jgi:hypothetical protein
LPNIAKLAGGRLNYDHRNMGESNLEWTTRSLELVYERDAIRQLIWLWDECIKNQHLMWFKERPKEQRLSPSVKRWLCMEISICEDLIVTLPQKQIPGACLRFQMEGFKMARSSFNSLTDEFLEELRCDSIGCSIIEHNGSVPLIFCSKKSGPIELLRLRRTLNGTSYKVIFKTSLPCQTMPDFSFLSLILKLLTKCLSFLHQI